MTNRSKYVLLTLSFALNVALMAEVVRRSHVKLSSSPAGSTGISQANSVTPPKALKTNNPRNP